MRAFLFLVISTLNFVCYAQITRDSFNISPDYNSVLQIMKSLKSCKSIKISEVGLSDIGKPLHLIAVSNDGIFDPVLAHKKNKVVILINNSIHPGEPDGTDACLRWLKDFRSKKVNLPDNVLLLIVPVFNVDGYQIRNPYSRANQNGPLDQGFRGNAKNLDLNRDFIKADANNTTSLINIIQKNEPDVFMDTHVSNGADYQHIMTLISTQPDKLGKVCGQFMRNKFTPDLFKKMKAKGYDMVPYVETKMETPDSGIVEFMETPRYSTGYTTLFNIFGFVSETHMWKPYHKRVWATYDLLDCLIQFSAENANEIRKTRHTENSIRQKENFLPAKWELDTLKYELINFKGYHAEYKNSNIGEGKRLFYDRTKPVDIKIKYYNRYLAKDSLKIPQYYLVPQAYEDVINRLKNSGVKYSILKKDSIYSGFQHRIKKYNTRTNPYESHYLHFDIQTEEELCQKMFYKGDVLIPARQPAIRFIVETLEPQNNDSFFAWNFFDGILGQKEWFSDYIFEEKAAEILNNNKNLKSEFDKKMLDDTFRKNHWEQLNFIYQNSEYKEKTHMLYPVMKLYSHN
jgi:hypothetical protein